MITLAPQYTTPPLPCSLPGTSTSEAFRSLAQRLGTMRDRDGQALRTIGVTGCSSGAGVSSIAASLAAGAADIGAGPVLLVDLSSASPSQASTFGLTGRLGLQDAVGGTVPLADCPRATGIPQLSLLAPNTDGSRAAVHCDATQLRGLLDAYCQEFELIVVDLPPANETTMCLPVAGVLSGVLFVVEAERTRCEAALRAQSRLMHAQAHLLGVILNKRREYIPHWLYKRL